MILTAFHGFCMALADSVPGVSGGTIAFIPFIAAAERTALKKLRGAPFALLGMAVVVGLTLLRGSSALGSVSFASLSPLSLLYIFLSGAVAITAMVLPGILGSSILLTAGVYLPAIQAVRTFLHMELSVLPGLFALGFGVLAGVALSIHAIRTALHKYRSEMVWLILGLMLGSLYAIVYGAVNLTVPLPPMSLVTFDAPAPLLAGQQRAAAHRQSHGLFVPLRPRALFCHQCNSLDEDKPMLWLCGHSARGAHRVLAVVLVRPLPERCPRRGGARRRHRRAGLPLWEPPAGPAQIADGQLNPSTVSPSPPHQKSSAFRRCFFALAVQNLRMV